MNEATKGGRNWIAEIRRLQAQIDALDLGVSGGLQWSPATYSDSFGGIFAETPDFPVGDSWSLSASGFLLPSGTAGFTLDLNTGAGTAAGTYAVSGTVRAVALSDPIGQQAIGGYSGLVVDATAAPLSYQPNNGIAIIGTAFVNTSGSIQYTEGGTNNQALVCLNIVVQRTA